MKTDFENIPEYKVFKDFTTMDELSGRDKIDTSYKHEYFEHKDIKNAFNEYLKYFKQNGFEELYEQYLDLASNRSYRNFSSINEYNNFEFNHPMVAMLAVFIEHGFMTRDLEYNPDRRLIHLGKEVLSKEDLRRLNISEGIIFDDGVLLGIKSNVAHKIGALWVFLNGKKVNNMIRYTSDCINPEPIFTSLSEYVKMKQSFICITKEQAIAMYNIHTLKSRYGVSFEEVLENSADICITPTGSPLVRFMNAQTFERVLGKDKFNAKDIITDMKSKSYLNNI